MIHPNKVYHEIGEPAQEQRLVQRGLNLYASKNSMRCIKSSWASRYLLADVFMPNCARFSGFELVKLEIPIVVDDFGWFVGVAVFQAAAGEGKRPFHYHKPIRH